MSPARLAAVSALAAVALALVLAALVRPCARPVLPDPVLVPLASAARSLQ